ncbi:hypothetical protein HDV64DRAFT_18751 [Trichoderma sp. TUCIM 5745]
MPNAGGTGVVGLCFRSLCCRLVRVLAPLPLMAHALSLTGGKRKKKEKSAANHVLLGRAMNPAAAYRPAWLALRCVAFASRARLRDRGGWGSKQMLVNDGWVASKEASLPRRTPIRHTASTPHHVSYMELEYPCLPVRTLSRCHSLWASSTPSVAPDLREQTMKSHGSRPSPLLQPGNV